MSNWSRWLGWVVAGIAVVAAGVFAVMAQKSTREARDLQTKVEAAESRVAKLTDEVTVATAKTKEFEDRVGNLERRSLEAAVNAAGARQSSAADTAATNASEQAEDKAAAPFAAMFSGEKGEEMAKMSAEMTVNMQYAQFFQDLGLPAESESQVKEILTRNLSEQMIAGIKALQEHAKPEAMAQMRQSADLKLRQELASVLNPEEMASWDEYQATLPERMLRQTYDMQLTQFAPGLSPEAHDLACDVLVDEMMSTAAANQTTGMPSTTDIQAQIQQQRESAIRAHDRLAQELAPDQLALVDRLLDQQISMMEMSMRMFDMSQSGGAEKKTSP